jgi:hypothetical protein
MKTAVFVYALLAILVLASSLALATLSARRLGSQLAELKPQLAQLVSAEEGLKSKLQQMEAQQQHDRALYTPQQAVQASYAVQEAQSAWETANAERGSKETEVTTLQQGAQRMLLLCLPLGIGLLMHLLLVWMLWPRRVISKAAGH